MEIILDNLVKTYKGVNDSCDVTAVKGVSLHIPSNKIFGIIGKSGAGKSSLVRLISLLENPDSGSVFYDNKKVDNLVGKDLLLQRRKLGMIFQKNRQIGQFCQIFEVNKSLLFPWVPDDHTDSSQ